MKNGDDPTGFHNTLLSNQTIYHDSDTLQQERPEAAEGVEPEEYWPGCGCKILTAILNRYQQIFHTISNHHPRINLCGTG